MNVIELASKGLKPESAVGILSVGKPEVAFLLYKPHLCVRACLGSVARPLLVHLSLVSRMCSFILPPPVVCFYVF